MAVHSLQPTKADNTPSISASAAGTLFPNSVTLPPRIGRMRYTYNLHGWITRIETECLKEYLSYASGACNPCFNGNISSVSWENEELGIRLGFWFNYDNLNRMTRAYYGDGLNLDFFPGFHDEMVEYDWNGNITKLERHGMKQDGSFGIIDNLKVSLMGNRIAAITDDAEKIIRQGAMDFKAASDGRATYTYNAFGALTSDTGRDITMIQYDNFHNPIRIQFANGSVTRYVYSADGAKLRTVHYTAMPNITVATGTVHELTAAETQAVDSVDYLLGGNLLLRNGRIDKYLFEGGYCEAYKPVTCIAKPFIPTFDGFIEPSKEDMERFDDLLKAWEKAKEANFNMDNFNYYFYNTDHLGNIREVVDATGHVMQATSYYPFGMPITDRHSAINPDLQPFKYNGKELDMMHGLNTYDYGARQYDPILGRWDRMDPLCEKYYSVSPYAYCGNNPVRLRDRAGMEPGDAFESLDEAALNFCSIFNYWSIRPSAGYPYGAEYASTFYSYKNEDNKTLYSYYVSGPQNAASALLNLQDLEKVPVDRRKTFQLVASGHTHGGDDSYSNEPHSGNRFSNADLVSDRDIHKQVSTYTAGYLATPNGTFMKHWFNKKSGKWMIITFKGEKYQLPSDANDSTHGKYTFQDIKKKYDDTPWYKKILTSMNKYLEQQQYK